MSNILAIAHKELKAYFSSPIAYIVIGFSAILFGWFFVNLLYYFERMSLQAGSGMGMPESISVNDMLIAPLFLNVTVILLEPVPAKVDGFVTLRIERSDVMVTTASGCLGAEEVCDVAASGPADEL